MRFVRLVGGLAIGTLAACQDIPSEPQLDPDLEVSQSAAAPQPQAPPFLPGQILMRVASGADDESVARAHGLTVAERGYSGRFTVLRGAAGNERAAAARLANDVRVVWAEPNWLRRTTVIDPRMWAFYNPGDLTVTYTRGRQRGRPVPSYKSTADADEDNVEGYGAGGTQVMIGSIDTGVDFTHPEFLSGQLVAGRDWYNDDDDPSDDDGHGTHTTGTMVGETVGVAGVSGAGANVKVYVQKVCGSLGCPTSAIANAIEAAADQPGMVAMNLSLGGSSLGQAEADAIAYAMGKDVLVIAAAGNDGTGTVSCPACDPRAISVAATNWQDELSYYSSYGSGLDLSAPGGELYGNTTDEAGIYSAVPGGYAYFQGTSMATPQVTGTAGVVASVTGLTGSALRSRIESSVDDLGNAGYDTNFGHGRLNSYRAVTNSNLDEGGGNSGTLTASSTYGCNGATCTFDASGSVGATSWDWDFGNATGSGEVVSNVFTEGDWVVTLTVGDGSGATDTSSTTVGCKARGKNGLACR